MQPVFAQYCSACHGATGEGGIGPALKAESAKKSLNEVTAFIKNPKEPMPKLYPAPLSDQDVDDVAAFVQTLKQSCQRRFRRNGKYRARSYTATRQVLD